MTILVDFQDLSKTFGKTRVLSSLSFSINEGELFFLLGPSGCGKTTLLRIIAGLLQQDQGQLQIAGQDMHNITPENRGIGMVFQNYALWPHLNVRQHVEFGLKNHKTISVNIKTRVNQILDLLQITDLAARFPHELSGGQQQRISLARALAPHPKLLLLDEPLSNLDPTLRDEMRQELKKVQRELGLTFIYVTHDRTEALAIGDRIAILNNGSLEQIGEPLDLYFAPKNAFVAEFLGDTNLLEGSLIANPLGNFGVQTEFGFFTLPNNLSVNLIPSQITLSLRPEDIYIDDTNIDFSKSEFFVPAVIKQIIPLGNIAYVRVLLSSAKEILCSVNMRLSLNLKEGMKIEIGTTPDKVHWMLE